MYEIELENGNVIQITGNHKVLIKNNTWKRVDELHENDEIISFDMMNI
jgi:intein/homing endonuclease